MAEIPQKTKFWLFGFGPQMHAQMAFVANFIGIITFLLGIASAIVKKPLGLQTTNWFLLTIILFIWGLSFWLSAYYGAKEGYTQK